MAEYVVYADSASDLDRKYYEEWNVKRIDLCFSFVDEGVDYADGDIPFTDFYNSMRAGRIAKTSAVPTGRFKDAFREDCEAGRDIFYLGFSSGLSGTYNSGRLAMDELREEYPNVKMIAVDSLSASTGYGLLLYYAVKKRDEGATIEELEEYITDTRLHLCHWFTVDDLVYLKRGGRINPAAAFVGGVLGIKPVLHVDDYGHLVNVTKARGRKGSIKALADHYTESALDPENGVVMICQGDCPFDAAQLAGMLRERHGVAVKIISYTGTVIGAHSGPGTLALFFLGDHR
jgi:DegV family protein with EDD domain